MAGGRPRKIGDEICSCNGSDNPGFSYFVTVDEEEQTYHYPRFRHNDRTMEDHAIKDWGPSDSQELTEYNRKEKRATFFASKSARTTKAYPVVIYNLSRLEQNEIVPDFVGLCGICFHSCTHIHDLGCKLCNNATIVWCPNCRCHWDFSTVIPLLKNSDSKNKQNLIAEIEKSKIPILKLKDVYWFLKTSKKIDKLACNFLLGLCKLLEGPDHSLIITYGDKAAEVADRIGGLFECDLTYETDRFAILKRLERKITMRWKQSQLYNHPPRLLS